MACSAGHARTHAEHAEFGETDLSLESPDKPGGYGTRQASRAFRAAAGRRPASPDALVVGLQFHAVCLSGSAPSAISASVRL